MVYRTPLRISATSSSRKLSFLQGESELLLLLAAQFILYAIYHSLTFFFFGELFYRLGRDINRDERFVAYHPAVVPRLDHVRIARTKICLCAIVHNELQMTRNYIPRVAHLAAIGLRNGPYTLGPLPSWLKNLSRDLKVLDGSDLHLALFEFPGLIRSVQALSLSACLCHSWLLLSPLSQRVGHSMKLPPYSTLVQEPLLAAASPLEDRIQATPPPSFRLRRSGQS